MPCGNAWRRNVKSIRDWSTIAELIVADGRWSGVALSQLAACRPLETGDWRRTQTTYENLPFFLFSVPLFCNLKSNYNYIYINGWILMLCNGLMRTTEEEERSMQLCSCRGIYFLNRLGEPIKNCIIITIITTIIHIWYCLRHKKGVPSLTELNERRKKEEEQDEGWSILNNR